MSAASHETSVFKGCDDPRKPWTSCCECGYISWHTSQSAAFKAIRNHVREQTTSKAWGA